MYVWMVASMRLPFLNFEYSKLMKTNCLNCFTKNIKKRLTPLEKNGIINNVAKQKR